MDPKRAQLSLCSRNLSLSVNFLFHFSV
jgi:hypothetical protein